jgi:hypothetical protein
MLRGAWEVRMWWEAECRRMWRVASERDGCGHDYAEPGLDFLICQHFYDITCGRGPVLAG